MYDGVVVDVSTSVPAPSPVPEVLWPRPLHTAIRPVPSFTKLSKYGNGRLRYAFWMAATIAVRQRENSFREKLERYIRRDPLSADRKRMAYVAVAAKMARVIHGVIKSGIQYRCFHEAVAPGRRAVSVGRRDRKDLVDNIPTFHLVEISF